MERPEIGALAEPIDELMADFDWRRVRLIEAVFSGGYASTCADLKDAARHVLETCAQRIAAGESYAAVRDCSGFRAVAELMWCGDRTNVRFDLDYIPVAGSKYLTTVAKRRERIDEKADACKLYAYCGKCGAPVELDTDRNGGRCKNGHAVNWLEISYKTEPAEEGE